VNAAPIAVENPRPWWLTLLIGILAFIIGAIMLWAPTNTRVDTYQTLIQLIGIYWLVLGVLDLVHMFTDHTNWGWKLFSGIVGILAGSYIVMYPMAAGVYLPDIFVLVLGLWGIFYGIVALIMAFKGAGWVSGVLGALAVYFGIDLVANYSAPGMGLSFILVAAIGALIGGVVLIVQAFQQKGSSNTPQPA